jgi:hypothetical protein
MPKGFESRYGIFNSSEEEIMTGKIRTNRRCGENTSLFPYQQSVHGFRQQDIPQDTYIKVGSTYRFCIDDVADALTKAEKKKRGAPCLWKQVLLTLTMTYKGRFRMSNNLTMNFKIDNVEAMWPSNKPYI